MNKLKSAAITCICTFALFIGASKPARSADFQIEGTFGPSSSRPITDDFASFKGTFTLPDDQKVDTYNGRISTGEYYSTVPNFNINYYYGPYIYNQGTYDAVIWLNATESVNAAGERIFYFTNKYSGLTLSFSPNKNASAGLSFKSGEFSYIRAIAPPDSNGGISPVTNATITPISIPEPSTVGALFFLGATFLLQRKMTATHNKVHKC